MGSFGYILVKGPTQRLSKVVRCYIITLHLYCIVLPSSYMSSYSLDITIDTLSYNYDSAKDDSADESEEGKEEVVVAERICRFRGIAVDRAADPSLENPLVAHLSDQPGLQHLLQVIVKELGELRVFLQPDA